MVGHQVVVVVGRGGLYKRIHKQQTDFGPRFSIPIEMSVMIIRFCLFAWEFGLGMTPTTEQS